MQKEGFSQGRLFRYLTPEVYATMDIPLKHSDRRRHCGTEGEATAYGASLSKQALIDSSPGCSTSNPTPY